MVSTCRPRSGSALVNRADLTAADAPASETALRLAVASGPGPRRSICSGARGRAAEFVRACADDGAGDDAALETVARRWRALRGHGLARRRAVGDNPRAVHGALGGGERGAPSRRASRALAWTASTWPTASCWRAPSARSRRRRGCRRRRARARHALTRDDAMYICADSLRDIDGMARRDAVALCFRLTRACSARSASHLAAARPRGDRQPPDAPQARALRPRVPAAPPLPPPRGRACCVKTA